jgi:hypothetical protein
MKDDEPVIAAGVSNNLYAYSRYGQLTNETVQGLCASAPLRETISCATDALGRSAGFSPMTASTGHAWSRSYEPRRNLISRFGYENDAIGRRVSRADSGIAFDNPAFDKYTPITGSTKLTTLRIAVAPAFA